MDTGIQCAHNDFAGRCTFGLDATGEGSVDENGHGTHVASTAVGAEYGLARRASVVAIKVGGDQVKLIPDKVCTRGGSCPADAQLAGINFAASRAPGRKVVANMSIGSVVRQFM